MSIERSVKRATRRQELDRIQWAGPDKIDYHVTVTMCFNMEFAVTNNFEGVILKGYGNVLPLRSYEAPTVEVVPFSGELISGPYWFGRAFDAPPFFTFSATLLSEAVEGPFHITVGVAEWHLDEQDMYVGATLWYKVVCQHDPCDVCGPWYGII